MPNNDLSGADSLERGDNKHETPTFSARLEERTGRETEGRSFGGLSLMLFLGAPLLLFGFFLMAGGSELAVAPMVSGAIMLAKAADLWDRA